MTSRNAALGAFSLEARKDNDTIGIFEDTPDALYKVILRNPLRALIL